MQDISISEAHAILQLATAVSLEGQLIHPTLYELEDDYNQKCVLDGSVLVLVNTDGQEEAMEILVPYYHKGS
jgi:hypothetical protein